jgi:glutamate N-acetyltransferase/amino-acid N-acetyltransferase
VSVTTPEGFRAGGVACGIKSSGAPDLALVATTDAAPVPAAAVFTANKAAAAPVAVSRAHLAASGGLAAAVVLNSGNANAATGAAGLEHARRMCAVTASTLGCPAEAVLVCSTGLIGIPLPIERIEEALPALPGACSATGGNAAAEAIRTTDTHAKEVVIRGEGFSVGGMAKGAAMLAPHLATMLAVLTTDARLDGPALQVHLAAAVRDSFNALSVDGCTSTNDTVIVLASGRAGSPDPGAFSDALAAACADLAGQMAGDAEGASKVVRITVTGAANDAEAGLAARKVAESSLVKCSLYGEDPYWGRVVSELGSAGVSFNLDKVTVGYGGVAVAREGVACEHDRAAVQRHLAGREIHLDADLGLGEGRAVLLTNDLTPAYIDENMRTS